MSEWDWLGRMLVVLGAFLILVGLLFWFGQRLWPLGRLPGDIYYRKGDFVFYLPLVTSLILSLILTLLCNLFWRR